MTASETTNHRVRGLAVYERVAGPTEYLPVVLVHGSMDRSASFVKAIRRCPGLHTVRYDRRGYGRSYDAEAPAGDVLATHVEDLVAVIDAVLPGRRCVLVGHSLGGVLVLGAGQALPETVMAIGAFEAPTPWASRRTGPRGDRAEHAESESSPEDVAERFMRRMVGDEQWERLPQSTRCARRAEGVSLVAEMAAVRDSSRTPYDLTRIEQPVVAGTGSESTEYHIAAARHLGESVDRGEVHVIEGAGHGAHHSHPQEFAGFVMRVLELTGGPVGNGQSHPSWPGDRGTDRGDDQGRATDDR